MMRLFSALFALLLPLAVLAAEPLGRLFYTPAQRTQLDIARTQKSRAMLAAEQTEAEPVPQTVTLTGTVRRSDGKSTVWINNKRVDERNNRSPVTVVGRGADGSVTVQTPQSNRSVSLKVGQSIEVMSGRIEEPYTRQTALPKSDAKAAPKADAKDGKDAKSAPASRPEDLEKATRLKREDEAQEVARLRAAAEPPATPPAPPPPPAPLFRTP